MEGLEWNRLDMCMFVELSIRVDLCDSGVNTEQELIYVTVVSTRNKILTCPENVKQNVFIKVQNKYFQRLILCYWLSGCACFKYVRQHKYCHAYANAFPN